MFGRSKVENVTLAEALELQKAGAVLLDVREDDEWAAGHAPDAVHVPLGEISGATEFVGREILTVCRSGSRSERAAKILANGGNAVRNVGGGMSAWAAAGLPVVRDGDAPGTVI